MSDVRHTPGPWRVVEDGGFRGIFNLGTGQKVAAVIGSIREGEHIEGNARLIAAAPELLEALREIAIAPCMAELLGRPVDPDDACWCPGCRARAAIAKTEDRS